MRSVVATSQELETNGRRTYVVRLLCSDRRRRKFTLTTPLRMLPKHNAEGAFVITLLCTPTVLDDMNSRTSILRECSAAMRVPNIWFPQRLTQDWLSQMRDTLVRAG